MDDELSGVKARLQSALASAELLASGVQEPSNTSTKFEEPYYQRRGLLDVKVEGDGFFKHADFENSTILQSDTSVSSGGSLNLKFKRANEAYLQEMWARNVKPDLLSYMQLQGKVVDIDPGLTMDPLPSWSGKGDARPDIG